MKITRDNNNNVSYTLETNDIYAQQIIDYWTPEKKAKAIPIMPCIEDEIEQPNITTTDPEIADLKQMPFSAGGKLFFSGDGKMSEHRSSTGLWGKLIAFKTKIQE